MTGINTYICILWSILELQNIPTSVVARVGGPEISVVPEVHLG